MKTKNYDDHLKTALASLFFLIIFNLESFQIFAEAAPVISDVSYGNITQTSISLNWKTDMETDSKVLWMAVDSNYQPLVFSDSVHLLELEISHIIDITHLKPAQIYFYRIESKNEEGMAVDSGYFITQSESTGKVNVYFNHTINSSVATGEIANGKQSFTDLFIDMINNAQYSIDITLWDFKEITQISDALIKAKKRGVRIRFVYNHTNESPILDTLRAHGIPILKRFTDTSFSMHNKFWIFDYRNNENPDTKYLWTGSTNIDHKQLHSDRNNIIIVQDEALCAAYTREFEEMWGSHTDKYDTSRAKFGPRKTDNVPHIFNVAGLRMEVYFSPTDSVAKHLTSIIQNNTDNSLFFCMLKFVLPEMEKTLHELFNEQKRICGVFDSSCSILDNSAFPRMKGLAVENTWNPPAEVFIDTIDGLIHHKYFIIDASINDGNKITGTGSFNWEIPANEGNDENCLIIYNERVNNLYYQEFVSRFTESGGILLDVDEFGLNKQIFILNQNNPNPFSERTVISYSLDSPGYVSLAVFNIFGKEVDTIVNGYQTPGKYTFNWDAVNFPSGLYYFKLSSGKKSVIRKMILSK